MIDVIDVTGDLKFLAEGEDCARVKTAIGIAARLAGLSYWRAYDIWYGKARRLDWNEVQRITAAARKKRENVQALKEQVVQLNSRIRELEEGRARVRDSEPDKVYPLRWSTLDGED